MIFQLNNYIPKCSTCFSDVLQQIDSDSFAVKIKHTNKFLKNNSKFLTGFAKLVNPAVQST